MEKKLGTSLIAQRVKNLPSSTGHRRDEGSVFEWERSPGGGQGNPLQYSCLENAMDIGAWWTTSK